MADRDLQRQIFDLLPNLRGERQLKELVRLLNYDLETDKLDRSQWGEAARSALVEDPQVIASGANRDFRIIYSRLNSDRLLLGSERPVVSRLLRDHPYSLFVFSNASQERWHFVNAKYEDAVERRRVLRRITAGRGERYHTASERLALLDLDSVYDSSPLTIQTRCDEAFDVEAVTKEFFETFAKLYHRVKDDISGVRGLEREAGKLAQLLMDRMLFLYFIQKKGWLNQEPDYLYSRFLRCWSRGEKGCSYYHNTLYPLFLCLSNKNACIEGVGAVPFLNGGLFEEDTARTQVVGLMQARMQVRDLTFRDLFDDLLEKFNFTITEDTPFDVEVAIDPEMLGKVFESLILQLEKDPDIDLRKLTGSYYTPRPIVHFMCREAFVEYLAKQLAGNSPRKAEETKRSVGTLIDMPPADHLDDEEAERLSRLFSTAEAKMLRQAVLDCRVCDPAVGSGAFPVGMLQEMVAAVSRLDRSLVGEDILDQRNYYYDLKKRIIENCLYGVDIQEQAVRLCELRLWLSLVVDYQIEHDKPFGAAIREVPSLPNLSYRVVRGDSLLERLFGHVVQLDQMARDPTARQLIESVQADKQAYFREGESAEKRRLELKILAKQADLAGRLVEAKRSAIVAAGGWQTNAFGEEHLTAKERKAKAAHEARIAELEDLRKRVAGTKAQLESMSRAKGTVDRGDLETLRRQYFHTEGNPSFIWRVDFAEVFREKGGFDIVIGNPPYLSSRRFQESKADLARFY